MSDLIKALTILLKYGDPPCPTHCEHDELWVCGIDPQAVSAEDRALEALGFHVDSHGESFRSYRFGSA